MSEGRWASVHQSEPIVSPPLGVRANHQVVVLMPCGTKRTLPSPRPVPTPPVWNELAMPPLQLAALPAIDGMICGPGAVGPTGSPSSEDDRIGPQSGQ